MVAIATGLLGRLLLKKFFAMRKSAFSSVGLYNYFLKLPHMLGGLVLPTMLFFPTHRLLQQNKVDCHSLQGPIHWFYLWKYKLILSIISNNFYKINVLVCPIN